MKMMMNNSGANVCGKIKNNSDILNVSNKTNAIMLIRKNPKPCRIADLVLFMMAYTIPMEKRPKQNPIILKNPEVENKSMFTVFQRF